jgi:hypothetical protein
MHIARPPAALILLFWAGIAMAQEEEYRVDAAAAVPSGDVLSQEIAEVLAPGGVQVVRGERRAVCEIWLAKQWPVPADFTASREVQFPFHEGQLIGVIRFRAKGSDFREREIRRGVYTLRYAQQPVDGNHVGTSPTRDFLCLVQAASDRTAGPLPVKKLIELSAEASESNHPALLSLQPAQPAKDGAPAIRHDQERDWWILSLQGIVAGGKSEQLPIGLVVVGHAAE